MECFSSDKRVLLTGFGDYLELQGAEREGEKRWLTATVPESIVRGTICFKGYNMVACCHGTARDLKKCHLGKR